MTLARTGANYAAGKFRPDFWSKNILSPFYAASVANKICNSDFLGELVGKHGETVHVRRTPSVALSEHLINGETQWQDVNDEEVTFTLAYAYDVAAKISKVDKNRNDTDPVKEVVDDIKKKMKIKVDSTIVQSAYSSASTIYDGGNSWLTNGNPSKEIALASSKLDILNVDSSDRWLLLDPTSAALLRLEQGAWAQNAGTSQSPFKSGQIGTLLDGMEVFVSTHVTGSGTNGSEFNCMMGHKSAICMAVCLDQITYFDKLERYLGSEGVTGLLVFGFGVPQPDALVHFKVQSAA